MLDAVQIGLSGLQTYSRGLQTISNNVANMNTPGFKGAIPRFSDLYYGTPSDATGRFRDAQPRFGSGVSYLQSYLNFAAGDLRDSDGPLDLGVSGAGFLTMLGGEGPRYARTGQFRVADDGRIVDSNTGMQLGILAADGTVQGASVAGRQWSPPRTTTTLKFTDNLSSGSEDHMLQSISVFDANGNARALTIRFTHDDEAATQWKVAVESAEGGNLYTGMLPFVGGMPQPGQEKLQAMLAFDDGTRMPLELDFSSGVTGFSAGTASTLRVAGNDGYAAGTISAFSVDDAGQLTLQYSNGQEGKLGLVALAQFSDRQRLIQHDKGLFEAPSGMQARFSSGASNAAGHVKSGVIEASNVDLSAEFGQLILVQRGFQASSQVISTANEMLLQLFQLRGQT
ncbi:flagellar hook-basal body complex protein [Cupriavidus sp. WS]|uniref:flagellar hook-basal body complex protein n=1 Tax=Cupriavidus sp. WS TaxID=1312922 RepID=UPI00037C2B77|nr:flagellar hook-basal body complex protein [Cupriavidus sp. WS]